MRALFLCLALAACGDNTTEPVGPDALHVEVDAAIDAAPDAAVVLDAPAYGSCATVCPGEQLTHAGSLGDFYYCRPSYNRCTLP